MGKEVAISTLVVESTQAGQGSYVFRATFPPENPDTPIIGVGAYLVRTLRGVQQDIAYGVELVIFSKPEDSAVLTEVCAQAGLVLSAEEKKYTKTPDGANIAHDLHGRILVKAGLPVATRGRVLTHAPGTEESNFAPPTNVTSALTKLHQISLPGQAHSILPPSSYCVAMAITSCLTRDFLVMSGKDQGDRLRGLFAYLDEEFSSESPPLDQEGPPRGDPTMRSERGGPRTVL